MDISNCSKNHKGIFIVIEGIDGSGKSTLCQLLEETLIKLGHQVVFTSEPGGSKFGKKIRTLLLESKDAPICPEAEFLLFAANRAQNYEEIVIPALINNDIVISSRSSFSSIAYQGYGKGVDIPKIKLVNRWACQGMEPDLVVFLNIDVRVAKARLVSIGKNLDKIEMLDEDFFQSVVDGFINEIAGRENALILDATLDKTTLLEKTLAKLTPILRAKDYDCSD